MGRKPITALRVDDLDASVAFYTDALGYTLDWHRPGEAAQVNPGKALPMLLLAPGTQDYQGWMNEAYASVAPVSGRIYVQVSTAIEEFRDGLLARGIGAGAIVEGADGDKTMELADPSGRPITIYQEPTMTDTEILARYENGPAELEAALAGLSEAQLDLVRAPGKWSIRQTVHHMSDSESSTLVRFLMALAEPGRSFRNTPYNQDNWVSGLDAAHRPIEPSLALIKAVRAHILAIVRHLPDALDRTIDGDLQGISSVREMLARLCGHVAGHAEQIRETRRVHGV